MFKIANSVKTILNQVKKDWRNRMRSNKNFNKRAISLLLLLVMVTCFNGALASYGLSNYGLSNDEAMGFTPSGLPISNLEEEIDAYVSDYIGVSVPGAAVTVVKDGEIIFSKGYGYGDVKAQTPIVSSSSVFEWGSITKLFTWTAAMQLSEAGKLDLNQEVTRYFSDTMKENWTYRQPVTMHNLMNHTGGFGDYAYDLIYSTPQQVGSLESELLKAHPKQYIEVGSASAYSNYGTALAGHVVEQVSGLTYNDYLKENFYDVLDMESTSADRKFNVSDKMKENKVKGYKLTGLTGYEETIWSYVGLGPAGSLNGTVEDLAKFAIGLTPGKGEASPLFKKPESLKNLLSPTYMLLANGFFEFEGEKQSFGHGGNTAGFTGQFAIVPEERFAVVVLTNVKGESNVCFGLQELLIGKKNVASVKPVKASLPSAKLVEGEYVPLRRFEGSFLEILSYLSTLNITALNEREVALTFGGLEAKYVQTEPHYYEITSKDTPIFNVAFPILQFDLENEEVVQLNVGHGFDLQPLPLNRSKGIQIISLSVLILSIFTSVVGLIVVVIKVRKIYKKELDRSDLVLVKMHGLTLALLVALINNVCMSLGMFLMNSFRAYATIKPFILSNYVVLIGSGLMLLYMFKNKSHFKGSGKYKILVFSSLGCLVLGLLTSAHWNFFVLH